MLFFRGYFSSYDLLIHLYFSNWVTYLVPLSFAKSIYYIINDIKVDQAILSEEDRVVLIRFGHDWDPTCMMMDETLFSMAEKVKNFCVIYLVDISEVPDFNKVYIFWTISSKMICDCLLRWLFIYLLNL